MSGPQWWAIGYMCGSGVTMLLFIITWRLRQHR